MPLHLLFKGLITGFLMAAPIGPIGILCIRGVLLYGKRRGFVIGLSGACGDIIYSTAAAFGVKIVFDFIVAHQPVMRLAGGIMLIGAGIVIFRHQLKENVVGESKIGEKGIFVSTLLLALTNPLTLFGYVAEFSAIGVSKVIADNGSIVLLIIGVFCGSFLWFSLLVVLSQKFKEKVTTLGVVVINKIAGVLLIVCGIIAAFYGVMAI
jgi:threonine/homoserine/homoserine lactone efflux protein